MIEESKNIYRERLDFSKIKTTISMPDLLAIQKQSYAQFLQMDLLSEERKEHGLEAAFLDIFPISDFKETTQLDFISYSIGNWECKCGRLKGVDNSRYRCKSCGTLLPADTELTEKEICPYCGDMKKIEIPLCDHCGDMVSLKMKYSPNECIQKGYTYAVPLRLKVRLISWEKDPETKTKRLKHIKEQEVYFGDIPLMTDKGTFIFNGIERVVVSQLQRSPGVFFRQGDSKGFYVGKIIPYRGAWVEFEYDSKNILYVRLDRKKKFLVTVFLRALGFGSDDAILRLFHAGYKIFPEDGKFLWELTEELVGKTVGKDIADPKTKKVVVQAKKKISREIYQELEKLNLNKIPISEKELKGAYSLSLIKGIVKVSEEIDESLREKLRSQKEPFEVFFPEKDKIGNIICNTLKKDVSKDTNHALAEIYRKLRPGEPHTMESAHNLFRNLFFNPQKYNFSRIGRLKMNIKLGLDNSLEEKTLSPLDFVEVIKYLLRLRKGEGAIDDIDHLGNRRVRSVGELIENAFRIGLTRMERTIKEKMTVATDLASAMPQDLINSKPVIAALKEFFGSSQLSQFMDQINSLAEITHKRRLSALGPGGLSRERAGFEVRDIQSSHYGRICPIETPEGPNIGLISSLSCFARVNDFGFIETPYQKVKNGRIIDYMKILHPGSSSLKVGDIVEKDKLEKEVKKSKNDRAYNPPVAEPYCFYLTAWEEEKYNIAQANASVDEKGNFINELVSARQAGNFRLIPREQIDYIDVSPKQLVSLSAALIPFLEHDDANRALMGSNMQRQAVPLLRPEAPLVGTGMEHLVAKGSGDVILCRRSGVVEFVDAERILVRVGEKGETKGHEVGTDLYLLTKFLRTNQNTCINHRPIVRKGDRVEKGQILADSSCTEKGESSLGRNILCAFLPWRGYNFEDAIIVSEKLIKDDIFTSIHIVEETIEARDTKLGPEEITRDIPNVPENVLRNLDENGIVRIGAHVKSGDILVGKVAPKGETQLSPEEKLLKAIFGEKALDVKDASLYCSPGIEGTVIDVRIFSRRGIEKGPRAKAIEREEIAKMKRNLDDEISILEGEKWRKIKGVIKGENVEKDQKIGDVLLKKGTVLNEKILDALKPEDILKIKLKAYTRRERKIKDIDIKVKRQIDALKSIFKEKVEALRKGDELSPGVIQAIKVFIAMKRKLSVGDKISGRHGNKGVIAKIVPDEDMPRLPDGTPVDIVLNPLGVPSRMNVGQILETHLGWAAQKLGLWISTPVFDGICEKEIKALLKKAGLPESGKVPLYDGISGELLDHEVTVGYIYIMKLYHLVDDKIHARSTGPYSLITQQPLGGKAQFGGQRFGEMEVWALEAYGAAYTLQELMTVKSDDVEGRAKIYEAIVKGDLDFKPGLPESVNVLIRELQSLCLNVELEKEEEEEILPWGIDVPQILRSPSNLKRRITMDTRQTVGGRSRIDFDRVRISIASPEKIKSWSWGEVTKPETINYRTFKPEKDGLFCAKIFGPINDYECLCGKYKRMKYRGIICERCGVEVTRSKVRRERMGHIQLASSVAHIWFFKGIPSRIGLVLDLSIKDLEKVLYFESYIVSDPGETPLREMQLLSDEEYKNAQEKYGDTFEVSIGAEAIKALLERINITKEAERLRKLMKKETSQQRRLRYAKRLRVFKALKESGNRPDWMILDVIPVIPPDLRPLVRLDGGRFATSDLNDLYRRVINRNNRLKKLIELKAPELIIRNEKRMLQEAVDALFDNGKRGRVHLGANRRPLKSLSEALRGKQGRFRQNLLGKRVDYSGRSVIVVGPELRLNQCGLPKKMALELFKPFIFHKLEKEGLVPSVKVAREWHEQERPEVWDYLEEVVKEHPILLNRAPTLHRLGIQAFEPVLVEGKAIQIHPLVCAAFNADFDGDQMAVHIPLSVEAQVEAQTLMLSTNNILSPAHGRPLAIPSQDMVLGCYYLTLEKKGNKGEGRIFTSSEEVLLALEEKKVDLHARVKFKFDGPFMNLSTYFDNQAVLTCPVTEIRRELVETTPGRIIFNNILPESIPFINGMLRKKGIESLIYYTYLNVGLQPTIETLDKMKELGFNYATLAGFSLGIDDFVIPEDKSKLIAKAQKEVQKIESLYREGTISAGERFNRVVEIWTSVTDKISNVMIDKMREISFEGPKLNPLFVMADSGSRGNKQQIRQLAGMRGLMSKPSGEIIETPIISNLREGLNVLQYFISTHGARKGLADTALKTANSGYLTRKLVDVSQEVIADEHDCGTLNGINVSAIVENGELIEPFVDRIVGRISLERVLHPDTNEVIVDMNEEITEGGAQKFQELGIERVKIRSVLTCESKRGVCQLCYGRDMATGYPVELGEAVGIIAAQSIGEPGTQLTMRTFHIGGIAMRGSERSKLVAKNDGVIRFNNLKTVVNKEGSLIVVNRNANIAILDHREREVEHYQVPYGAKVLVNDGVEVKARQEFAEWDPYNTYILTEEAGFIHFHDVVLGLTMEEIQDEFTGKISPVIIDPKDEKMQPQIIIKERDNKILHKYFLPSGANLEVKDKDNVFAGDVLAKIPREVARTKDITGGLPRAEELFEARRPKTPAVISEIDGVVKFGGLVRGYRKITVHNERGGEKEYLIPKGAHLSVGEGEKLRAGTPLMDGPVNPHDILKVLGEKELAEYLLREIQEVYRLQGVTINDKHIEAIIRQMLRWVKVEEVGDTEFLVDEQVDKFVFQEENEKIIKQGGKPAKARPLLLGITKSALSTDSFISAASFQETTRVLTEASLYGKVDHLRRLKENIIMGRLIPAGTGYRYYRNLELKEEKEEEGEELDLQLQS